MKKLIALLLCLILVISMAACASDTQDPQPEDPAADAPSAPDETPSGTENEPEDAADKLVFGYVISDMSHEWYQNIAKGARMRAEELGIELKIADAAMDVATQVNQIENLLTEDVDVQIITPVDVNGLGSIMADAASYGIPVITESNTVDGAVTMVGIDNITGGKKAGLWFAEYAEENQIDPKILVVGAPSFPDARQRVEGFKAGMDEAGLSYEVVAEVDCNGSKETALMVCQDALTAHPEVNVIFGINDNAASGGMAAYKEAGLDESLLTTIGFGFEGAVGREALLSDSSYKAAVAMFPDFTGTALIDAAVKVANGEEIPEHYETATVVITQENFDQFYTKDGDSYITNFDAIRALMEQ